MQTKQATFVTTGIILIAAVMAGYLILRPIQLVRHQTLPIFMGEEIVVNKAAKAVPALKTEVAKAAEAAPVNKPSTITPLPIVPPSISYRVIPAYPEMALLNGQEGVVLLSIFVGTAGSAEKVEIKASSGVPELDRSAVSAVSQWKFNPALSGGQALASWFEIPVRFALK